MIPLWAGQSVADLAACFGGVVIGACSRVLGLFLARSALRHCRPLVTGLVVTNDRSGFSQVGFN